MRIFLRGRQISIHDVCSRIIGRGRLFAAHQHSCFSWSFISLQCPTIPARYIQVTKLSGLLVQLHFGNEAYYRKIPIFLTAHEHDATWKRHSIALYTPRNAVIYGFELLLWLTRISFFRFLLHIRLTNRVTGFFKFFTTILLVQNWLNSRNNVSGGVKEDEDSAGSYETDLKGTLSRLWPSLFQSPEP